ncbi:hypothetical protein GGP41_001374 [Bipolaris sorokiniana]|uniref:Uncharacterized protein n=1 Tax=Cochliobolus sativus TaxID=45130 RepID=A0A8H5Z7Z5_COCSA|nr:hypothetical protein GGP41_001374 [Bipolaris sorokiniana]
MKMNDPILAHCAGSFHQPSGNSELYTQLNETTNTRKRLHRHYLLIGSYTGGDRPGKIYGCRSSAYEILFSVITTVTTLTFATEDYKLI